MAHQFYKHKLLLDEGFSPRSYFPQLNQRFDIKHVKDDLKKIGLPDTAVYELSVKLNRLIITPTTRKIFGAWRTRARIPE